MSWSRLVAAVCVAVAFSLTGEAAASAQGRHGPPSVPPGQVKKPVTATPTAPVPSQGASSTPSTTSRIHTFGSWLDNAEVNAPGEAWISLSSGYWRSESLRQIDAPAAGISVGVAPGVQLGVSLPYSHLSDRSGATSHGFGASYVTGKIALTPGARLRTSVSPTLEILNWSSPDAGVDRVNWILPLSVQADTDTARVYATGGYVSRGSIFGSGAVEWSAGSRLTLVANASHSYSVTSDPVSDALGITRHRTDAGGGAYLTISPSLVVFANVGRTLAPVDASSAQLSLSAGIALNVAGAATRSPRVP